MYKTEAGKFPVVEFIETIRVQSVRARIVKVSTSQFDGSGFVMA